MRIIKYQNKYIKIIEKSLLHLVESDLLIIFKAQFSLLCLKIFFRIKFVFIFILHLYFFIIFIDLLFAILPCKTKIVVI